MRQFVNLFYFTFVLMGADSVQAMKLRPELSRDELNLYVQAKREKYQSLASHEEITEESRKTLKLIDNHLNISLLRFRKSTMRDEILRKALTTDFENVNSIIKKDLTLEPLQNEWKANVQATLERSQDAHGHDTLIVGCGHIKGPVLDGNDHLHEGHYTINKHGCEDGASPDFEADISKTYLIQKKFPKVGQFQTVYLEYITEAPLQSDVTFKNALHLLKPGGQLIFDNYFSCLYLPGANSEIDRFSVKVGSSPLEVKFGEDSPNLDCYQSAFAEIGVDFIADKNRHYIPFNDKLEECAAILTKKYLESLGFINVAFEKIEDNPYNHRKNSRWILAQKPE